MEHQSFLVADLLGDLIGGHRFDNRDKKLITGTVAQSI